MEVRLSITSVNGTASGVKYSILNGISICIICALQNNKDATIRLLVGQPHRILLDSDSCDTIPVTDSDDSAFIAMPGTVTSSVTELVLKKFWTPWMKEHRDFNQLDNVHYMF